MHRLIEVIPAIFFPEPYEKTYVDNEDATLFRGTMMQHAKEIFGPLLR